ncbi:MAG: hypothetical protein IJ148_02580 [Bacteroidaceae bacterium]|nr:hypothetical protein [Bacteroidaceae bacterium]MBQ9169697.1 hypothetical protein [Bacteroidaceae bacterium]
MKKVLFLLMLLCPMIASAQDVIVKKDGSTVVCRVEKVSETDITYKLWSDLKGSSYVMDKSLVSAINYESGKKETFSETTSLYTPNNQNNGVQALNDRALLRMDYEFNNKGNGSWSNKKIKRLKTWGWIGGGVLAAGGILLLAAGVAGSDGFLIEHSQAGLGAGGAVCLAAGIGVTTTCLVIAHKQKKKLDAALEYSSLYRYDIPFSNGSQLSVGADMLHDRIMDKRTIGLGLSYNF